MGENGTDSKALSVPTNLDDISDKELMKVNGANGQWFASFGIVTAV